MTSLNVSLPEALREFVAEKVQSGSYGTASEYIRELIRNAQQEEADQDRVEGLLLEALKSPVREMAPDEWDKIRERALQRLAARTSA